MIGAPLALNVAVLSEADHCAVGGVLILQEVGGEVEEWQAGWVVVEQCDDARAVDAVIGQVITDLVEVA